MKLSDKIALLGFALLLVALAMGFVWWKKINKEGVQVEIKIDEIEDERGLGYSGQRKIVVDKNGDVFVAYRKKYEGKSEIFVAKVFSDKNEWKISGTENPISAVDRDSDQRVPSIAVDNKNNIHVVWYGSDTISQTNNRQIKYSKSQDGGTSWTVWKNISFVDGYDKKDDYWQEHPYLLVGANGELFAVWEGKDKENKHQQIKFSKSIDDGETWNSWKNIKATPENTQSRPTLVQSKAGRLLLFAYSSIGSENGNQQVVFSWSDNGGDDWSDWEIISDPSYDSRHVSATMDNKDNLHLVWRSQKSSEPSAILYRSLRGGSWSEIKEVAFSNRYQFFPSIGGTENGKINITWMESEKKSNLPTENPEGGKIYRTVLNSNEFFKPIEISKGNNNLYPHIPETFKTSVVPAVYESGEPSSKNFGLILQLVR
ncbi:MAG: hypothetical protein US70_C0014G0025 [Parcubacteria group bacterium GW2011_GWD2_38_11]|nr:MAG: hypothetical protein US70_C0014G0025 [Parcubacteria group bacterium GW2011_GWD2_38_11]